MKRLAESLKTLSKRERGVSISHGAEGNGGRQRTAVDRYWSHHTVNSKPFGTAKESADYLEWRFAQYPLYREFMNLWGEHEGETILDYGCGPGDDVTGFLLYTGAAKVIGVDVSAKALALARHRLDVHGVQPDRFELLRSSDATPTVPLESESIDYFQSSGVLHHTSRPEALLQELNRVLRPGGDARVMVYNYDSVWLHLYTAYVRMVLQGSFRGLSVREAFGLNTDGEDCPIARCYTPSEFARLCEEAGFAWEFEGGYPARLELDLLAEHREAAIASPRLAEEHRHFLRNLESDEHGYPMYRGKHAGVGGVYHLQRA